MTELVKTLSDELASIVESLGPSAVRVEGRRRLPASGIAWSPEGIVVTANHVLERDEQVMVGLGEGERLPAELIGRDPGTDLAALRLTDAKLPVGEWSPPEQLQVGHLVLALGRPGESVQATLGIISALGEGWHTRSGGQVDRHLQTDVVMYPGFSGGPLVGMDGAILGMNTSALRGVSLAVPTPTVRRVMDALVQHGRVRRGYLGVGLQPAHLPEGLAEQLDQRSGLIILSVEPGSPADKGKLTLGDTILGLDGTPVRNMDDLMRLLSGERVGKQVELMVLRGGVVEKLPLTVGERK